MTPKHPLAFLFQFVDDMDGYYDPRVRTRLSLYLDLILDGDDKTRQDRYEHISEKLNATLPPNTNINISHLLDNIPSAWPWLEWFEGRNEDLQHHDDIERNYPVFDYEIIYSSLNIDHKRLIMMLILLAVESVGNTRVSVEISKLRDEISDKDLLETYSPNPNGNIFNAVHGILSDFTPVGSDLLIQVVTRYQNGEKSPSELLTEVVDRINEGQLISKISSEIADYSKKVTENKELISGKIGEISKTIGISEEVSSIITDISTELVSKPEDMMEIISNHTRAFTGVDEDSFRGIVKSVRESIPIDEMNEIAETITNAVNGQQERRDIQT